MKNIINNIDLDDYLVNIMKSCHCLFKKKDKIFTSYKSDGSPVSNFDKNIDELIFKLLKEYDDTIKIISEEKKFSKEDFMDKVYWIIDPIDGTRSFVRGENEFTVNIALIIDGHPELGVIYHPPSNKLWLGKKKNLSIYKDFIKEPSLIKKKKTWSSPNIICSRSLDNKTKEFINSIKTKKIIRLSSSLKFCYISESIANFYPRLSSINKWDIAAGHAILLASGGELTDFSGTKIKYDFPSEIVSNFVASDIKNWKKYVKY